MGHGFYPVPIYIYIYIYTLPETNSEFTPENGPLAPKRNHLPTIDFQGRLLLVSGRVRLEVFRDQVSWDSKKAFL